MSEEQPHLLSPGHLQITAAGERGGDSVHRGRAEPESDEAPRSNAQQKEEWQKQLPSACILGMELQNSFL